VFSTEYIHFDVASFTISQAPIYLKFKITTTPNMMDVTAYGTGIPHTECLKENTGLLKMNVGVLTTCHTQYT